MWRRDLYELLAREQNKPPLSDASLDRVSDWFEVHPQFIRCEELPTRLLGVILNI